MVELNSDVAANERGTVQFKKFAEVLNQQKNFKFPLFKLIRAANGLTRFSLFHFTLAQSHPKQSKSEATGMQCLKASLKLMKDDRYLHQQSDSSCEVCWSI